MPESGPYGSVRGAPSNERPYRDSRHTPFFAQVADVVQEQSPVTAEKLRRASPHWMRHTHATHALERGVGLTTVRDNLRHASVYLHTDKEKRARELGAAFAGRR